MSPPYDAAAAAQALARADPRFAPLVAAGGPPDLGVRPDETVDALVRSVVYQQLSGKAAATIHSRLRERFAPDGPLDLFAVLGAPDEALRACGLSRAKTLAVKDVAARAADGRLPTRAALLGLDDDAVVAALLPVRGVGVWTVQMLLLFTLGRPDVWPVADLGVQEGFRRVAGLAARPTAREMGPLGEPLRPWRSVAAWYCWRAADGALPA